MNITQAPQGISVVVETEETVYIGRLGSSDGKQVRMHDVAVFELNELENAEDTIRQTAKYGIPVEHRDILFETQGIQRVRKLGEIPKA